MAGGDVNVSVSSAEQKLRAHSTSTRASVLIGGASAIKGFDNPIVPQQAICSLSSKPCFFYSVAANLEPRLNCSRRQVCGGSQENITERTCDRRIFPRLSSKRSSTTGGGYSTSRFRFGSPDCREGDLAKRAMSRQSCQATKDARRSSLKSSQGRFGSWPS
jgi:hypothetical protein